MKRALSTASFTLVLALLLCGLLTAPAGAAQAVMPELPEFSFASGAGGWWTSLSVYTDGTFSGNYHDSDMGDSGPGYPNGTVYICEFSGKLTDLKQIDDYTWSMRVGSMNTLYESDKMWIEDGVKYVASDPHGMPDVGGELRLYLPGHPTASFSEEFLFWIRNTGSEPQNGKLTAFALHNVGEDQAFGSGAGESAPLLSKWTAFGQRQKTAYASTQTISIDGWQVEFEAYALKDANGNDTNYVKLRDVAAVLNGTGSRFQVGWDGAVNITTGKEYTQNGTEMNTPFTGDRVYEEATAPTKVNGQTVSLSAILLKDDKGNGYTYYKLRDLGAALGFTVNWNAQRGMIEIETRGAG